MSIKEGTKRFWNLLWKDDSWKGWIFSIIFLFIFIKFIFFPGLSLITGTPLPLAIVESCSMFHEENFLHNYNNWWETHETKYQKLGINEQELRSSRFHNGFNKGDILFIIGANIDKIKVGDVIIFNGGQQNPLIHRVIKIEQQGDEKIFSTIGDNNNGQLSVEKQIKQDQVIGKAVFKIAPYIGWLKLIFYEQLKSEHERGMCNQN